ncbi:unnamed protein product [Sphagnum tenellum]
MVGCPLHGQAQSSRGLYILQGCHPLSVPRMLVNLVLLPRLVWFRCHSYLPRSTRLWQTSPAKWPLMPSKLWSSQWNQATTTMDTKSSNSIYTPSSLAGDGWPAPPSAWVEPHHGLHPGNFGWRHNEDDDDEEPGMPASEPATGEGDKRGVDPDGGRIISEEASASNVDPF